jgi:gas vesicle protein
MRKGFWRAMITGGIIGAALGMLLSPQLRPRTRERIMRAGATLAKGARRLIKRAREASSDLMQD